MRLRVLYFGRYQDDLGRSEEELDCELAQLAQLRTLLAQRDQDWARVFGETNHRLLCAINQQLAKPQDPLADGDEVAFFPPVTGG